MLELSVLDELVSEQEKADIKDPVSCAKVMDTTIKALLFAAPDLKKVLYTTYNKDEKGRDISYGYYSSLYSAGGLLIALRRLKPRSITDLGIGTGLLMMWLKQYVPDYPIIGGIELNEDLFKIANNLFWNGNVIKKDLLNITKRDIANYDVIHMWDPFVHIEELKIVLDKVISYMTPSQIVCLRSGQASAMVYNPNSEYRKSLKVEIEVKSFNYYIFFKLKK